MPSTARRWAPLAVLFISLLGVSDAGSSGSVVNVDSGFAPIPGNLALDLPRSTGTAPLVGTAPQKAYDLLHRLEERSGLPLSGYVGGREFQNRERRLPRGRYREYDVNPKIQGRNRDAERIVIEHHTGKAYYTGDHYRTFTPLN